MKRHKNTQRYTNLKEEKKLMKNKNNLLKFTNIVLFITMIAIILVSGTYAKYTSTASGTSATVVANWSFNVNDKNIAAENTFEFNLFDTANIKDSDGNTETDVEAGLIAPGTSGAFEFALENTSDVTAKYEIKLGVTNTNNIPLEFSFTGEEDSWTTDLENLVATDVMTIGSSKNVTVQWRWPFGDTTVTDATLGGKTVTVQATITATQVNYKFLEKLEQKYELSYYSTFNDAIDAVNDGIMVVDSATNKETAGAAVYIDENNLPNVVLLKDTTEIYLYPTVDMIINLGGHIFTSKDNYGIYCPSGNIYIDGRLPGSGINVTASDGVPAYGIMIDTACNLTIDGGTYTSIGTNQNSAVVMNRGTITAQNATFIGKTITGRMDGFSTYDGSTTNIINSDILASGQNAKTYGVFVGDASNVTITDSDIKGYANYNHDGRDYTAASLGIYHSASSTLILNDSHVIGNLAGMQTYGTLYIDGGILEGYGHGGIYFVGTSSNSYVKNATIRESDMFDGYTANNGTNHVGFYIGGNSQNIYMDNCDISSSGHSIVMRASGGEKNNNLYISNSRIPEGSEIRIDNNGHTLYNGAGNNFTLNDTTLPEAVIDTDIDYSTLFPEY